MGAKILAAVLVMAALIMSAPVSKAQGASTLDDIQKRMVEMYPPAKATADGTDIVTAGAVVVLQKDNLVMNKVEYPETTRNFYKNGAISVSGAGGAFLRALISSLVNPNQPDNQVVGNTAAPATREFVTGEKFWVWFIRTLPDGVVFNLMSDPINDQRYRALLTFVWSKNAIPTPDDVAARVSEVLKVDAGNDSANASQDQSQGTQGDQQSAVTATETKTLAIGQSRDQVIASFGVPTRIVKLGTREIDYFPDMKVTFVNNKVTDVN